MGVVVGLVAHDAEMRAKALDAGGACVKDVQTFLESKQLLAEASKPHARALGLEGTVDGAWA